MPNVLLQAFHFKPCFVSSIFWSVRNLKSNISHYFFGEMAFKYTSKQCFQDSVFAWTDLADLPPPSIGREGTALLLPDLT